MFSAAFKIKRSRQTTRSIDLTVLRQYYYLQYFIADEIFDEENFEEGLTNPTEPVEKAFEFSTDPAEWVINDSLRDYVAKHNYTQNKDLDFARSKRICKDDVRYLNSSLFERKLLNGEKSQRIWLVYSPSKGSVYCAPCFLFDGESAFADKDGFRDWKNASLRVSTHENSAKHQSCVKSLKDRATALGRIDKALIVECDKEVVYWQNVLKRVVAVIKKLSSRGLALRGHDENFGSLHNGNFMMSLELIAEFDPFLADHISRFGNKGTGSTSYLSKTICEEFIQILANMVLDVIKREVSYAKYFSIIVDSSPDISHVDQLCFLLRYVQDNGMPVERFVKFLPNVGHKAVDMDNAVSSTLEALQIDIKNCRGQSYDTARNMSGIYAGLQQLIKNRNEYAEYVPCAAHSLNLVGTHAVESCPTAADYFNDLQSLYNFFTASTSRWEVLQTCCGKSQRITVKSLSITRWSARNDAVCTLESFYTEILQALHLIENDVSQKAVTRSEAKGIRNRFESLETAFMQCLWSFLLPRFNAVSKKLQSAQTYLSEVVQLYKSLIKTLEDEREDFNHFEKKALDLAVIQEYKTLIGRVRRKKIYDDETRTEEETLLGKDNFKVKTYDVIFDNLLSDLHKRTLQYEKINDKFSVIIELENLDNNHIREKAKVLQEAFSDDLETSIVDELLHFKAYLNCNDQNSAHLTPIEVFELFKKKRSWFSVPKC